jgi:hypothetical protein
MYYKNSLFIIVKFKLFMFFKFYKGNIVIISNNKLKTKDINN